MLPWIVMSVAIISLTICFTLEIIKLKNNHSRLSEMAANYSQLQNSYEILNKKHSQLIDQVNRLNKTITRKQCPDGWTRFGCSCYFKSKDKTTWSDSRTYCQQQGADLVIINSEAEQVFIKQFNKNEESWIGLEGTPKLLHGSWTYDWKWVDGSPLTQPFWGTGWPKYYQYQAYGVCCDSEGKWKHAFYNKNWICEK
uniref:CD209 antigen-like protein E n=1 Tax=Poecilia reticulata TaxID=8081 RepID=A0A3P9QDW7_POERE